MSPMRKDVIRLGRRFPRVSGDEPADAIRVHSSNLFSPRERG